MGDLNIHILKFVTNNIAHKLIETFVSASFLSLVSKPTRVANLSATLIDNIFSNITPHPDSSIILSDTTDHYLVMTYYTVSQSLNNHGPCPLRRKVNNVNLTRLSASLENVD